MFLFKKEYCKCISMKHFKMKNTVNWESANVYHLNVSIFKGRIPMAKEPNLEKVLVTQSSPTLCDSMDCSLPGFMEFSRQGYWSQLVAIPFFKGSSRPIFPGRTWVSCIAGRFFTSWATREAQDFLLLTFKMILTFKTGKEMNHVEKVSPAWLMISKKK